LRSVSQTDLDAEHLRDQVDLLLIKLDLHRPSLSRRSDFRWIVSA
jgi:hypothetical protein